MNTDVTNTGPCQYGGYQEQDTIIHDGVWAALAERCWNEPSAWRMGIEAQRAGVPGNPYKGAPCRGLFEAGRAHMQSVVKNAAQKGE